MNGPEWAEGGGGEQARHGMGQEASEPKADRTQCEADTPEHSSPRTVGPPTPTGCQ